MPKKAKKTVNVTHQSNSLPETPSDTSIYLDKNGNIVLKISAKPGAKSNGITGINEEGIGVQINAPPVDGEANTELVKFLSSVLGVRKSDLSLEKGSKSRQKTVILERGSNTIDTVKDKLKTVIDQK
ncbi:hypothetical protein V9T40_005499 [Parthenolecanium corni]|uniref:Uncharacterized protein n=1 Tax=Parthenolecanium corni TaxID=536013 RepID=A0AAN9THG7_9HEMI